MRQFAGRDVASVEPYGEPIEFIVSNERLAERVRTHSNESYVLDKLIEVATDDSVLWDIGACFGTHSLITAPAYEQVFSFEPMAANRGILMDNKLVNEFDNVYVSPAAVTDSVGLTEFEIRESEEAGYGRHSVEGGEYDAIRSVEVPTINGDTFAPSKHQTPNVVKIDVEGAEGLVLDGMERTLRRPECQHVILETHEPNPVQPSYEDFGYSEGDLRELLEDAGFTVEPMASEFHWYAHK